MLPAKSIQATFTALLVCVLFSVGGAAFAGDEEDGFAAYGRRDYSGAAKSFRRAADRGSAKAQTMIGTLYLLGQGFPKDPTEAAKWLKLAADQDNTVAQSFLGDMYREGNGVPRHDFEALKWYRLAAKKGDVNAARWNSELDALLKGKAAPPPPPTVAAPGAGAMAAATPDQDMAAARTALERKEFSKAISLLTQALEKGALQDGVKAELLNNRAYAYNQTRQYQLAFDDLHNSLYLRPNSPSALVNRAINWGEGWQRYDKARDDLLAAQRFAGSDPAMLAGIKHLLAQVEAASAPAGANGSGSASVRASASSEPSLGDKMMATHRRQQQENCARAAKGANISCNR